MEARSRHRLSHDDLHALLAVTRHLAAPFDLDIMLTEVTQAACRILRAERSSVWLLDASGGTLVLEVAADLPQLRIAIDRGLVGACARERCLVNVPDCYADRRFDAAIDRASGYLTRCCLAFPLIDHRDVLVGVLQVLNKHTGSFDAGDEALGEALAAQCAVAVSRARLHQEALTAQRLRQELDLARIVQDSTLPKRFPRPHGYAMHAIVLPAEQTGGDTYDLSALDG